MSRKMTIISQNSNYAAGDLGDLTAANLGGYEIANPATGKPFPGKVFLGESLKATGIEASFQVMPPNMGMPFFHKHGKNEELYIVLKGRGEFTIDGAAIPVKEGSVVRVAPDGSRSWKNTGSEPMLVMCVQAVAGTLQGYAGSDGRLS